MSILLRNRTLISLAVAEAVSNLGSWVTILAIFALVVFQGDGGVAQTSGIMLAGLGPMLLASPLAGWLCDRFDRKWLMVASQLLSGLTVVGLMLVDTLPFIYGFLALQSAFTALMLPARQAAVRDIVADADLPRANALLQQLAGVIKIGGPVLGGALLALMEPHSAMLLDVVSYALAALLLTRLPALPAHRATSQATSDEATPQQVESLPRVLRQTPALQLLFVVGFLLVVVLMGFDLLSSIVTRDMLVASEAFFGLLIGSVGLGMVAATARVMLRKHDVNPWHDIVVGLLLFSVLPAVLALATFMPATSVARVGVLLGSLVGGVGNGLLLVQANTLIQRLSPAAMLGRMGGVFQSVIVGGQLITMFSLPLLVPAVLSIRTYCVGATVALLALALWTYLKQRALHQGGAPLEAVAV